MEINTDFKKKAFKSIKSPLIQAETQQRLSVMETSHAFYCLLCSDRNADTNNKISMVLRKNDMSISGIFS